MKKILFLFLLFFIYNNIFSQNLIYVTGKVNVPYANIKLLGSDFLTTSNNNGHFSLTVDINKSNGLHFTAIGYNDTTIFFNTQKIQDILVLSVSLSKKTYLLNEISISSTKDFFHTNNAILDIEFDSIDKFIVLQSAINNSLLSIIDTSGKVLKTIYLEKKYLNFFNDCFNNLELISSDTVIQLFINDTNVYAIDFFSKKLFNEKLLPFIFKTNGYYIAKSPVLTDNKYVNRYNNKQVKFYTIPEHHKGQNVSKRVFYSYFDESSFMVANSYLNEIFSRYNSTTPENQNIIKVGMWDGNLIKLINNDFYLMRLISWYMNIESKPVTVKAFKVNNNVIIVNLSNNTLLKYSDSLRLTDTINIETNKKVFKNVIQDHKTQNIYLVHVKNGINYLQGINIETGQLSNPIKACVEPFPKVFKIYANYSYSIYYSTRKHQGYILRKLLNDK